MLRIVEIVDLRREAFLSHLLRLEGKRAHLVLMAYPLRLPDMVDMEMTQILP